MDELIRQLSTGKHPIAAERSKTVEELKEQVDRKYVLIKFTDTKGGTELGFALDESLSQIDESVFEVGKGTVCLAGELELNYEKVRCVTYLNLETLKGEGYLELLDPPAPSS